MILPTPGANDASRLFGYATPPDGAGPIGPDQAWPQPIEVSKEQLIKSLNPLHHVPVVGMIYRAATGETIPTPIRVLGAGIVGGGLGAIGAAFMSLLEELIRMGPDLSRPSTPAGMSQTGSEQGVEPVTPGTMQAGAYLTLATETPEFLLAGSHIGTAAATASNSQAGVVAYQQASMEYQRSEAVEKGLT